MKSRLSKRLAAWLMVALISTATALSGADEKKEAEANVEDLANLKELLKLPKEDLQRVRLTLESIEKMTPTDRKNALQRIQNLNKMPTEQRKETIDHWNELSPEMKKAYFDYLRELSAAERTKFKALPWDKQIEQLKKTSKK
ncbi:MAG: DUF3106 domain-containing protein [Verrucomicrobia bacterium]|nr:DUF3106 domain-containing protein [Verrucomicrobiota bacterium]MDA1069261.1 DUF3106 domain-containing protein [Verrucomicrobiota bacterium]